MPRTGQLRKKLNKITDKYNSLSEKMLRGSEPEARAVADSLGIPGALDLSVDIKVIRAEGIRALGPLLEAEQREVTRKFLEKMRQEASYKIVRSARSYGGRRSRT